MNLDLFEEDVLKKIEQADLNAALELVRNLVQLVVRDPYGVATVFGSERLDRLCLAIGQAAVLNVKNLSESSADFGQKDEYVVTIATELGVYGGHTRVIEDIIKAQPEKLHIVLLTDLFNRTDIDSLVDWFSPIAELKLAPLGRAFEKLEWLITQLNFIQPTRIFLFNHHEDSVAVAAVQPWLNLGKVIFYHHADHHMCLGVHIPKAIHIDPHNLGYFNCRMHEGLKNNQYLPLVIEDKGARPSSFKFIQDGHLRTCSSGTYIKFDPTYIYSYGELISKRLVWRQGFHFHIGDLPDDMLRFIHRRLLAEGIDPSRFIHIPWVSSVWLALIEHKIDLYISSFPIGGGRASIEAMGSGTPLLMHENSTSHFLGGVDLVYSKAFVWSKPDNFYQQLCSLTPQILAKHSYYARRHYESYHIPSLMKLELDNILSGKENQEPPSLRVYEPDYLQRFLYLNSLIQFKHEEQIQSITNSRSWGITAPMRRLNAFFSRLKSVKL